MFSRILIILFLSSVILSCGTVDEGQDIDFSIVSPKEAWTYYNDTPVLLAVDVNSDDVHWSSSIEGDLGVGNSLQRWLSAGSHILSADIGGAKKSVSIIVNKKEMNTFDEIKILLNNFPPVRIFFQGRYYPCLISYEGSVDKFSIIFNDAKTSIQNGFANLKTKNVEDIIIRDFRPQMNFKPAIEIAVNIKKMRTVSKLYNIGDRRTFRVINTLRQNDAPHSVNAELCYSSSNLNLWKTAGEFIDESVMQGIVDRIANLVISRIRTIWGSNADIDGDNKITILLSRTINNEKIALGFFNSSDFFKYNDDPFSENYNPASNEMDIIYAALPEYTENSPYSPDSIIATIGHELTHAVNFTNKTWNKIQNSSLNIPMEEVFLDEGWSHLSENLLGYGVSGGNIQFFNLFLNDTVSYSFCRANKMGQYDSAGMRGAMTLFMSWLFWKKGGMTWDNINPAIVYDTGGIKFLQELVSSQSTGWDSIGAVFGKPTETLFREMIYEMNCLRINRDLYDYKKDKLTGEPVEFFVNMGDISSGDNVLNIGFPKIYSVESGNTVSTLPWSVVFIEPFESTGTSYITLKAEKSTGKVFLNSVIKK